MESLEEKLKKFDPSGKDEEKLAEIFKELAEAFLYGGYVSVKDCNETERYRIYLRTIEFYCHYEGDDSNMPKDPIVYHRNGKYIEYINEENVEDGEKRSEVPYFPLMAFHAHASGIDITFENKKLQLRSSTLIRAYEVYDVQRDIFLCYDREKKIFVECKDEKKRVNSQSTYLYYFLNGFIGESVQWVDFSWSVTKSFKKDKRKNVFKYDEKEKIKVDESGKKIKDTREWSYTRLEDLKEDLLK